MFYSADVFSATRQMLVLRPDLLLGLRQGLRLPDDEYTLQLVREIMEEISPLCVGHPKERVIGAMARVCSAVTSACASETSRADDLRAAADFLLAQAEAYSAPQDH